MAKYNIHEIKEKKADYRSLVSPRMMDEMQEQIMNIIVMQKKYREKDYSAQKLADEIGTNKRYQNQNVAEIGDMVGFANRQSFYASFFRFRGISPRQYRLKNLEMHPSMAARRK